MRQRLSVAGALLGEPRLLVLDEPANGLDPEGIRWLRNFLRSFADDGGTVFISSHVLAEVAQLADEVVIIHHAKLVAHESLEALTARASAGTVVRSPDAEKLRERLAEAGIEAKPGEGNELRVAVERRARRRDRRRCGDRPPRAARRGGEPRRGLPGADGRRG